MLLAFAVRWVGRDWFVLPASEASHSVRSRLRTSRVNCGVSHHLELHLSDLRASYEMLAFAVRWVGRDWFVIPASKASYSVRSRLWKSRVNWSLTSFGVAFERLASELCMRAFVVRWVGRDLFVQHASEASHLC
jgi:hypothetical protein